MRKKFNPLDIKAAIFDMDGTMIDNSAFHILAFKEFFRRHGKLMTDKEVKEKCIGKKNDQLFSQFFDKQLSKEEIKQFGDEKEAIYRELYASEIKEVAGLKDLLNKFLKKGIKLAIATTAPKENRQFALDNLVLAHFFTVIIGDEEIKHGKPHPEAYIKAAEKLRVNPNECIAF